MMLADSRWCHHPPLGNCTRCAGFHAPPEVCNPKLSRSVATGKWVLQLTKTQRLAKLKMRDRITGLAVARSESSSSSASSSESLAEPSPDNVARPPPAFSKLRQKPRFADYVTSDSLAFGASDTQRFQAGDEDVRHFRNGPSSGDLAEVEAFCRIFRLAEQVHCAVMEVLRFLNDARVSLGTVSNGNNRPNSQDPEASTIQNVALLEEDVVSRLGCIGALLHQQKQQLLGGKVSSLGSSQVTQDSSLPPLAQFRAEMKICCEQLDATLSYYFPPDDQQFTTVHRKFRRLRNVCFDAGYPRPEGSPSHADIPNWAPVRLWSARGERSPETDNEVAFWRGGHLTEEGVHWLINEGFKVIVDLRAEDNSDHLAKSALDSAVSLGKLRYVNLPVDPGNLPTKDQVVDFTKLAADLQNRPLYLHSREGIARTSAMVARWQEMALKSASQMEHSARIISNNKETFVGFDKGMSDNQGENSLQFATDDKNRSLDYERVDSNSDETSCVHNGKENDMVIHTEDVGGSVDKFSMNDEWFTPTLSPFEIQRPALNIFSRQAMSKFFKGRPVSPNSFLWDRRAKLAKLGSTQGDEADPVVSKVAEPAGRWGLDGPGIPRAGRKGDSVIIGNDSNIPADGDLNGFDLEGDLDMPLAGRKGDSLIISNDLNSPADGELNGFYVKGGLDMPLANNRIYRLSEKAENTATSGPEETGDGAIISDTSLENQTKGALFRVTGVVSPLDDTEEPVVVGDMCASRTGVVRLQSRKKAEMYLVRTDGFSCTREKVQESTLAFTHPSTQQQMLMWKTVPKTALLLKKLGNELMQEAQQVLVLSAVR